MFFRSLRTLPVPLLFVWALSWGCATSDARLGDVEDASTPPVFVDPSADAAVDSDVDVDMLMCIGTECPAPFVTCASESGPAYKCGTDISRDPNNCGACGNKCLTYEPLHMNSRCVDGACELECKNAITVQTDYRNCNGKVDDGCEVDVYTDPLNCGTCGHACGTNEPCIKGQCGCPNGLLACADPNPPFGLHCVDPKTDDANCGTCGHECFEIPDDACDPLPDRAYYGCAAGTCGHLKCGGFSRDCNGDLGPGKCNSDGCEIEDVSTDPNNCGGCGIKCVGDEECIDEGNGPECAVPCARFGKVYCDAYGCVDLLNDPLNCGGCDSACRGAEDNEITSCKKGLCHYECAPGFADCNGDQSDGCETNLLSNPGNCGACGHECNVAAGQPCIEGACLMTECDAGPTK